MARYGGRAAARRGRTVDGRTECGASNRCAGRHAGARSLSGRVACCGARCCADWTLKPTPVACQPRVTEIDCAHAQSNYNRNTCSQTISCYPTMGVGNSRPLFRRHLAAVVLPQRFPRLFPAARRHRPVSARATITAPNSPRVVARPRSLRAFPRARRRHGSLAAAAAFVRRSRVARLSCVRSCSHAFLLCHRKKPVARRQQFRCRAPGKRLATPIRPKPFRR